MARERTSAVPARLLWQRAGGGSSLIVRPPSNERREFLRCSAPEHPESERESRLAQADESIREALKRAREQAAKSLELRAATSLVLLRRDQNAPDDGRADLADLVGSLVDGIGTRDVAVATYPLLSAQVGLIVSYEMLP